MWIFTDTKSFPAHERFGIIDQIRRSSRSVCATVAEAWRKRAYPAAFKSKLADAMQEASETQCWLDFCLACGYLNDAEFARLDAQYEVILSQLNAMHREAGTFCYEQGKEQRHERRGKRVVE